MSALVELGDVRNHRPVARQVRAGNLLDARQRRRFDRAELGEIHHRPGQQVQPATTRAALAPGAAPPASAPLT
jgi:hypothetical protein